MHRSCLLIPILLFFSAPVFGQSSSTDSQTLQALLAEIRQLRHDLQTTTIAAQRAQILLYRLQIQGATVSGISQKLDEARTKLAETQSNRTRLTNDIKQNEEFAIRNENPPGERKQVEDNLAQLRTGLSQLENEEQQRQIRVMQVEDQLRTERTKLGELQEQLDRMDKILESSNQQTGPNPR
jgi:hypothetical protein